MRTDKWIWAVRMVKSRTLANTMCKAGKVFVNEKKVKPSKIIKIGDIVEVIAYSHAKKYQVKDFFQKRVSAEVAATAYENLSPIIPTKKEAKFKPVEILDQGKRDPGEGRPTKKDRRQLDEFKDWWTD